MKAKKVKSNTHKNTKKWGESKYFLKSTYFITFTFFSLCSGVPSYSSYMMNPLPPVNLSLEVDSLQENGERENKKKGW